MNVYYLGPQGSYSHLVAKQTFEGSFYHLEPLSSFTEITRRIMSEQDSVGIYPIENSVTSNVHENIDLLFANDLRIIGEANLLISLHIIGLKEAAIEDIREIRSNAKALAQCSRFLARHGIAAVETASTSAGREAVLQEKRKELAALGSAGLADHPDLHIIAADVANEKNDLTRFVIVSQSTETAPDEASNKMSFTFKLKHEPGSLAKVLTELSKAEANLTMISSRPIPGKNFEYNFWVDLEFAPGEAQKVVETIRINTLEYRVAGIYKSGPTLRS